MYMTVEDTFPLMRGIPPGILVEMGVYHGDTLKRLIEGATTSGNPFLDVYGFDSFEGLPEETAGLWKNVDWPPGAFSVMEKYNLKSVEEAMQFVRTKVGHPIKLFPGYFKDTCTEELGQLLHSSVSYFHIDCDIHASTKVCLEWALRHKILLPDCVVRFDDICSTPDGAGQKLALKVATMKFNITWEPVSENIFIYRT